MMKYILAVLCVSLSGLTLTSGTVLDIVRNEWTEFKLQHRKLYNSPSEEEDRLKIYLDTRQKIAKHNQRYALGLETYEMGINQFSDMTYEEFIQQFTRAAGMPIPDNQTSTADRSLYLASLENYEEPDTIDWRSKGAISDIRSQGSCGSCWAFAAVAALEAHIKIHQKKTARLSEQMLLDCSPNNGCKGGGHVFVAYNYIKKKGIAGDKYPKYNAKRYRCRYESNMKAATDTGYRSVSGEGALKKVVGSIGPVAIYVHVNDKFQHLRKGVFFDPSCPKDINHAIVVVGYGKQLGRDMWIVKNSWGTTWGDQGFGLIARNVQQCGIGKYSYYPTL